MPYCGGARHGCLSGRTCCAACPISDGDRRLPQLRARRQSSGVPDVHWMRASTPKSSQRRPAACRHSRIRASVAAPQVRVVLHQQVLVL